jgi:hypothetical protein
MVQRGRRAVYEPAAIAVEKPTRDTEEEYRRKERMTEHAWLMLHRGNMLAGLDPIYRLMLVSHRHLRYASGLLHLLLLASSLATARRRGFYRTALAAQLAALGLAAAGRLRAPVPGANLALYYVLVTHATTVALVRYLRHGVPATWAKPAGTR